MMLGLSVADPVPSSSSWDDPDAEVSDAEISDSEQPARSKAAEHARITRSILPTRDSQPPPPRWRGARSTRKLNQPHPGTPPGLAIMISAIGILFKDLPFLAGLPARTRCNAEHWQRAVLNEAWRGMRAL